MPTDDDAPRRAARAKPATAGEYDVIRDDDEEREAREQIKIDWEESQKMGRLSKKTISAIAAGVTASFLLGFVAGYLLRSMTIQSAMQSQDEMLKGKIDELYANVENQSVLWEEFNKNPVEAYKKYGNKIITLKFKVEHFNANGENFRRRTEPEFHCMISRNVPFENKEGVGVYYVSANGENIDVSKVSKGDTVFMKAFIMYFQNGKMRLRIMDIIGVVGK